MRQLQVYLDTSVINFLFAEDAPEFRLVTEDFFKVQSAQCALFVSRIVLAEIGCDPDTVHREKLLGILRDYRVDVLPADREEERERLAKAYLADGAIPHTKLADAMHVAYATLYGMDILLSWNFKHLANIRREERVTAVNLREGFRHPLRIVSPLEMSDEDNE